MIAESLTAKKELAERSPIYLLNPDAHPGTRLPKDDGPGDKNSFDFGINTDSIVLIEAGVFLRECIHGSLQSTFPLPVITYSSVSELKRQASHCAPRLIALSLLEVGKEASLYTLKTLLESFPRTPVIVLAYRSDPELARAAISCGAKGYIPFTMDFAIAAEAVRFVMAGGTYAPVDCLDCPRVPATSPSAQAGAVTNRELAVVRAIQQGKSNKVIAYDMNLSESTVKVHVRNVMKKLKAKNRTDVAMRVSELLTLSGSQERIEQDFMQRGGV